MDHRLLDVNAYTTLDFLEASARGGDWTDDAVAVLDVETPDRGDRVALQLELDPGDLEHVAHHADRIDLTPAQARTLAEALRDASQTVRGTGTGTAGPPGGDAAGSAE